MATLERAIHIAYEAHKGQLDRYGQPFILHVLRVMLAGRTTEEKIVGVLHDVVEKTPWTFDELRREGFSEEILAALDGVTKRSEDEDYEAFVQRTKSNQLAVKVKLNDLQDNMDITRMNAVQQKDIERLNKYLKAYKELVIL